MKKVLFILISVLALSWADAQSQVVGVSPASHRLWGETQGLTEFYVEYKFLGLHYFHNRDHTLYEMDDSNQIIKKTSALALSVMPLDLKYFRGGMIFFDRRFPVTVGSRVQFLLEASLPIRRFTISYRHISNGFGMFNDINPGIDSFSVKVNFGKED